MVYLVQAVAKANEQLSPSSDEDFHPDELLGALAEANTVLEAVGPLGLAEDLSEDAQAVLADFLATLPPAVDKTIVGVARDALQRGLRVALSWQPGVIPQVLVFETSKQENDGLKGAVHIVLYSPEPEAPSG